MVVVVVGMNRMWTRRRSLRCRKRVAVVVVVGLGLGF